MSTVCLSNTDYDLDPKFAPSSNDCRARQAARAIPSFVDQLLDQLQSPSPRQIELLYGEYRALYYSRRPFRSTIGRARQLYSRLYYYRYAPTEMLLRALQQPGTLSRNETLEVLFRLYHRAKWQATGP